MNKLDSSTLDKQFPLHEQGQKILTKLSRSDQGKCVVETACKKYFNDLENFNKCMGLEISSPGGARLYRYSNVSHQIIPYGGSKESYESGAMPITIETEFNIVRDFTVDRIDKFAATVFENRTDLIKAVKDFLYWKLLKNAATVDVAKFVTSKTFEDQKVIGEFESLLMKARDYGFRTSEEEAAELAAEALQKQIEDISKQISGLEYNLSQEPPPFKKDEASEICRNALAEVEKWTAHSDLAKSLKANLKAFLEKTQANPTHKGMELLVDKEVGNRMPDVAIRLLANLHELLLPLAAASENEKIKNKIAALQEKKRVLQNPPEINQKEAGPSEEIPYVVFGNPSPVPNAPQLFKLVAPSAVPSTPKPLNPVAPSAALNPPQPCYDLAVLLRDVDHLPSKELIHHAAFWFNLRGDLTTAPPLSEAVKWQLLHAAKTSMTEDGNIVISPEFGYDHLSIEDLVVLYRVCNSYNQYEIQLKGQMASFGPHIDNLEVKMMMMALQNKDQSEQIVTAMKNLKDSNLDPLMHKIEGYSQK